jgi:hypothetical protein
MHIGVDIEPARLVIVTSQLGSDRYTNELNSWLGSAR